MYLGTFKNRGKGPCLTIGFQKMTCIFRGRCGTLECPSSFCVAGAALDVSCCMFYTNRIGRAMSSGDKVQIAWQARRGTSWECPLAWQAQHLVQIRCVGIVFFRGRRSIWDTFVFAVARLARLRGVQCCCHLSCQFTWRALLVMVQPATLYTAQLTLHTPNSHSTLFTFHLTFHTLHFILCTLHFAFHILDSALRTSTSKLHNSHLTLYMSLSTLHTSHFTLPIFLHSPIPTPLHSGLRTSHSMQYIPHSTLHSLYSTLRTPHSALHPIPHSTVYTGTLTGEECTKLLKLLFCNSVLCDCNEFVMPCAGRILGIIGSQFSLWFGLFWYTKKEGTESGIHCYMTWIADNQGSGWEARCRVQNWNACIQAMWTSGLGGGKAPRWLMINVWNDKFAVRFFPVWSRARLSKYVGYHFVGSRWPASPLFGKFRHGWFKVSCRFERGVSATWTCSCKTFVGSDSRKTWSSMLPSHAAWWELQDRRGGVDRKPAAPATRTWSCLRFAKLVAASGNAEIAFGAIIGGFRTAAATECSISARPDSVGFETRSPWFAHWGGWPPPSLFEGTKMVAESASKASDESDSFLWDS